MHGRAALLGSLVLALLAAPLAAEAQQSAKLPTIGFLGPLTSSAQSKWTAAFVQRMRELGWTEGRTVVIQYRWAEGRSEQLAQIAAEGLTIPPSVLVRADEIIQ